MSNALTLRELEAAYRKAKAEAWDERVRAEAAETQVRRAEVALAKYARHLPTCDQTTNTFKPCTCGLRRALEKP